MMTIKDKHYGDSYIPLHRVITLARSQSMQEGGWQYEILVEISTGGGATRYVTSSYTTETQRDTALEVMINAN